jgi:hypothetical protein
MQITFRFRVKDKHIARLKEQAAAVNFVVIFATKCRQRR